MASHIAALGVLKYETEGGRSVTFPGDTHCTISSKNIKTADGRGVKAVEHTLTATGWVYSADLVSATGTVDQAFASVRQILAQSGGRLTIVGKGFGDYHINRDTINRDVSFGPHPEVVEWEPFGNVTCRFTWRCVFTLPWRDNSLTRGRVLDYTWSTSYSYDAQGFCSRTVNGELEIAATRESLGQTRLNQIQHIENYILDEIVCSCPIGWRRTGHTISINAAKTKASVSFTDEPEAGLIYPPGIVDMDIVHKMSSTVSENTLSNWVWSFHATAVPNALCNPIIGYRACLEAHQHRFLYMIRRLANSNGVIIPMPIQFEITENVKQRRSTLSATWLLMAQGSKATGTYSPADILVRSGLWQPFPWRSDDANKFADQPLGPNNTGGYSRLLSDPDQNMIIEISTGVPRPDIGAARGNATFVNQPKEDLLIQCPFGAYVEYKVWLSCYVQGGQWVNYPLTPDNNSRQGANIQNIGSYNQYRFEGVIARNGLPPSKIPQLTQVGGIKLTLDSSQQAIVDTKPVVTTCGMVIWRTRFSIPYTAEIKDSSNPVKSVNGSHGKKPGGTVLIKVEGNIIEVPENATAEEIDRIVWATIGKQ